MNKNIWIGLLVVVVLVVGWMLYSSNRSDDAIVPDTQNTNENVVENTSSVNTPTAGTNTQTSKSLIAQKGSYKCTFDTASSSGKSTDIIYIADGKLRAEFRTNGMVGNMMIYDGTYLYTWKEGMTTGTRVPLKSLAQLSSIIPADLTSGASYGNSFSSVGWDCHQWIKVSSMLTPSTAVKFTTGN